MKKKPSGGPGPSKAGADALAARDKRRILYMSVLLVLLAAAYFLSRAQESKQHEAAQGELPDVPSVEGEEQIVLPDIDAAELDRLAQDSTPAARASLSGEGLDLAVHYASTLGETHYEALGIEDLTREIVDEIAADPSSHRGQPLRARGTLLDLRTQRRESLNMDEQVGLLQLDDGAYAYFLVLNLPELVTTPPYIRVDGLFYKMYRSEVDDLGWIEAPLLVGRSGERSYPPVGEVKELPPGLLSGVEDDSAQEFTPIPFDLKWALMAMCRDMNQGDVDWAAAPELTNDVLHDLLKNGDAYRAQPIRIPISANMGSWVEKAPENPARVERFTTGWIGNQFWTGGVINYVLPRDVPELQGTRFVTARGFFLKNHVYPPRDGGIAIAPYFVMQSVDPFIPVPDTRVNKILWFVVFVTIGMIGLFFVLLMRDQRKAAALQAELVRRRRARREKRGEVHEAPAES